VEIKLENEQYMHSMRRASSTDNFKMHLNPDSSIIIPMRNTKFNWFRLRPIETKQSDGNSDLGNLDDFEESVFTWSESIEFNIMNASESELFGMKPVTIE
jgi:hypothetical protein